MLPIDENMRPTLGGHEKFPFRQGWLKKGFDAILDDENFFSRKDAIVVLGVGKNMVRSIRHWCLATGIIEEAESKKRTKPHKPTILGEKLMNSDTGWDPYLEDTGTLWLIHWQLATNLERGLVWYLIFSHFSQRQFDKEQLLTFYERQFDRIGVTTTTNMIRREIDCCLRTYVPGRVKKSDNILEDGIDCPLVELDLIRPTNLDNMHRFSFGPKVSLPIGVFGYGLIMFLSKYAQYRRTISVEECLYYYGSPGQVFKLDENSVMVFLEAIEHLTGGSLRLEETAGLRQIYLADLPLDKLPEYALDMLSEHYG